MSASSWPEAQSKLLSAAVIALWSAAAVAFQASSLVGIFVPAFSSAANGVAEQGGGGAVVVAEGDAGVLVAGVLAADVLAADVVATDVLAADVVAESAASGAVSGASCAPCAEAAPVGACDAPAGLDADGEVEGVVLPLEVAEGEVEEPVLEVSGVQAVYVAGATSPRKLSCAVTPSFATSVSVLFGTETTSWLLPCRTTVASVTPELLTRSVMIDCACAMALDGGVLPSVVFAVKMTWVPPSRSRPSFGVCRVPGQKTARYRTATSASSAEK
jgi:hypothetical protein